MAPELPTARRFDPLSLSSDGLNHAQTSELGRLFHLGGAASLFGVASLDQIDKSHQKALSLLAGQLADRSPGIRRDLHLPLQPVPLLGNADNASVGRTPNQRWGLKSWEVLLACVDRAP